MGNTTDQLDNSTVSQSRNVKDSGLGGHFTNSVNDTCSFDMQRTQETLRNYT